MNAAVLIINWNSGPHLRRLVDSLSPIAADLRETLILDNGSGDESCRELSDNHFFELEELGRNLGFAAAANRGIERLDADWIFLLNPDLVADPVSLRRLYGQALEAQGCAIVCGPLLDAEGRSWQADFQNRNLPTPWSVLKDALFLDELFSLFGAKSPAPEVLDRPFEIEQPAAAYWLLRRRAWLEVGKFDEMYYPAWFEDVDLCRRLRETGWKIRCFPDCPMCHVGGISVKPLGRREFTRIYYRNLERYLRKHHSRSALFLRPAVRLGSRIRQGLAS